MRKMRRNAIKENQRLANEVVEHITRIASQLIIADSMRVHSVLDVSVGVRDLTTVLVPSLVSAKWSYFGIDRSEKMLAITRERFALRSVGPEHLRAVQVGLADQLDRVHGGPFGTVI
jgi:ubiquinone/menaquinone biosynthesis C-methylase UbiE